MSGGSQTISNIEPAAGNLRIQTSIYGSAIPLVYGRARISGNLTWYGGFAAIPHTSTQGGGGKGGGGIKQSSTTFAYQAAVLMALGEGVMNNVLSGWRGKQRYEASPASNVPIAVTETITVPPGGVYTVGYGPTFLNNVQVTDLRPEPYDPVY